MTRVAAVLGAGGDGADWAARFAVMGWAVRLWDADPGARAAVAAALERAHAALPALYDVALPAEGALGWADTPAAAVAGAAWVHLGPGAPAVDAPGAVRASALAHPAAELRVAVPAPAYLHPLVALEGPRAARARAAALLAEIGMAPGAAAPGGEAAPAALAALAAAPDPAARDTTLVVLLRALRDRGVGAGAVLAADAARRAPPAPDPDRPDLPVTLDRTVPPSWADYNGHMNEARYLEAFSAACDRLLLWAGMTPAAVAAGASVFTAETHLRHLAEVAIGARIVVRSRVLDGGGRKFHIFQALSVGTTLCATCEQLLLHVDLATRRTVPPPPDIAAWLGRMRAAHAALPLPEGLGRHVGQRP